MEFASGQFVSRIVTDRLFPNSFPIGFLDFWERNFPIRRQFLFYPCPIGGKNEKNIGEELNPSSPSPMIETMERENFGEYLWQIAVGLLVSFFPPPVIISVARVLFDEFRFNRVCKISIGEGKGEEEDRRLFQRVDILFTIRLFSRSFLRKKEFLKIIQRHSQNP